jgi:rRNA maturation endonuclease Nob1
VFLTNITRNTDELNINLQEANYLVKEMFHNVQSCREETATAITQDGTIPNLRTQMSLMFNTQNNRSCHTCYRSFEVQEPSFRRVRKFAKSDHQLCHACLYT